VLPVPVRPRHGEAFTRIAALARHAADDPEARAEIHGRSGRMYGLDLEAFTHVLRSFPLVAPAERDAALRAFLGLEDAI
jgi:hypothetical protein